MEWIYFGLQEIIGFQSCIIVTSVFFLLEGICFHALFIELFKKGIHVCFIVIKLSMGEKDNAKK